MWFGEWDGAGGHNYFSAFWFWFLRELRFVLEGIGGKSNGLNFLMIWFGKSNGLDIGAGLFFIFSPQTQSILLQCGDGSSRHTDR